MRAYRGTVFLLAILALLAALVYTLEMRDGSESPTKPAQPVIWTVDESEIVELEVRGQGQTTALSKDGNGTWQLTTPEQAQADEWTLNSLLYRLAILNADAVVAERDYDRNTFGLDEPQLSLRLRLQGGQEETLVVGSTNPRGTGNYAVGGDSERLYLIGTTLVNELGRLLADPPVLVPTPGPEATGAPTPGS
ncbi:MAG: DUF4340 domain-containing protein [Chloroflexota bacterium]